MSEAFKCSRCKVAKDTSEFVRDRNSRRGHGTWCKPCLRAYEKQTRSANPGKWLATRRAVNRRQRATVSGDYLKSLAVSQGLPARVYLDYPHLAETKRDQILLLRTIRKVKREIKQ